MKLTSPVFILLCALLFCSYSFVISTPEVASDAIKKISSKLKEYEKFIPLINETLLRYCQLCEDIDTTYKMRLENYFGEDSAQYEMLSDAYHQFKDEEDELIDEKVLPSLTTIKNNINTVYTLMEETPDSEDFDNYEELELQIRNSLRGTLQSIELHILKVAEILGLKNDFVFKIEEFLGRAHKSQFSSSISPKKYLEIIRTLIEEIHEKIEEHLSTNSKLTRAQKLYITIFKNRSIEKVIDKGHLLWLIAAAVIVNPISGFYEVDNSILKNIPFVTQFSEGLKRIRNPQNSKKVFEKINNSGNEIIQQLTQQKLALEKQKINVSNNAELTNILGKVDRLLDDLQQIPKLNDEVSRLDLQASNNMSLIEKVKEALLLLKKASIYAGLVTESLKAAKDPLEKLLFPNKQDRMEKLGMYHPYARPDSSERDEVQKIYAQLKKRAQVKPKVKAAQIIGWEKLAQELQGKIEYCTGDGPLRYRNTELLPLIIAGEPGTGKSFTAEAIADVCGRNLYKLTPDMFDIQTLNNFFNMVDSDTPAIVFFDEANLALDQNDRHAKLLQSYLLPRLTAPANKFRKIYVILATNQPDKLPGDIWRRCDTLWLGLPRIEEREKALKIYLEENGYMCDASFRKLFVNLTEDMNFDDLHIILDTIKRELIRSQQNYIDEELFKKGLKSVYQHKLKSIAFDPKLSRTELLASFIKVPYTLFKKYIQEWKDVRRPISLEEIKNTMKKTGQTETKRFYFF